MSWAAIENSQNSTCSLPDMPPIHYRRAMRHCMQCLNSWAHVGLSCLVHVVRRLSCYFQVSLRRSSDFKSVVPSPSELAEVVRPYSYAQQLVGIRQNTSAWPARNCKPARLVAPASLRCMRSGLSQPVGPASPAVLRGHAREPEETLWLILAMTQHTCHFWL